MVFEEKERVPLKSPEKENPKLSFIERLKNVKRNITVEPALAFFVMPSVLTLLAAQNLNLDKACYVDLGFDDNICLALKKRHRTNRTAEENAVQELVASVYTWKGVVHALVPTILMLFIGAWSDKTGKRKICMLMPIFGEFLMCTLNIVNTYFFKEVSVAWTVFMEVIAPSLTGGWYTMFLGTFSYLGDITSRETRTFRLGILNFCMSIGFPVALALSGLLLRKLGYYGVFTISAVIHLLNFCYVFFMLEDHTWLQNKTQIIKSGCTGFLSEFFDFRSLKETLSIVFKKEPRNRRLRICLILLVLCLTFGPIKGEQTVMYLFVRYRFNWDEVKYSIFAAYNLILHLVGTLFAIGVLIRRIKLDDAILGIISTCSKICGALIMAFASTNVEAYISPLAEILSGTAMIALRSNASKLVTYQELGKVYSLMGIAETFTPLIFESAYSKLYMITFKHLPGTIFIMSAVITVPALIIFGWFLTVHRKESKDNLQENVNTLPALEDPVPASEDPVV